jgi:EmrB/QacA subfamily drug resistance transporter
MTTETESLCAPAARPYLLAATILASAMVFTDGIVVNVALPAIQAQFHVSFEVLQWTVNGYALALAALILTGGVLGDRYGRRRIFTLGITIFSLASIACALAPSAAALIGARAIQGVGGALLVPQSLAIIAAGYPREQRAHAVGIWAAAASITTVAGPILGGVFIDVLSWRAVFWINVPLAAATLWLTHRFVPESRGEYRARTDWLGCLLVTAGLIIVIYSLSELPGATEGRVIHLAVLLAVGVATLAGFIRHESKTRSPLIPLGIFHSRVFSATNAITVCLYFALSVVFFLLPYTLIEVHGYSGLQAGAAMTPFGLVMGVFSPFVSRLNDKLGLRTTLSAGTGLVTLACLVFALAESAERANYLSHYLPAILILAAGMTISVTPLTAAMISSVADGDAGVASGINNAVSRIAGVAAVTTAAVVSLATFPYFLSGRLVAAGVDADLRQALLAGASHLVALNIPQSVAADAAHTIKGFILEAYVNSYRTGMLVAAIAAAAAAVVALVFLPRSSAPAAS